MAIRLCPHCYARMQRCMRDGVIMDLCIQCGGIFLDGGELEYLVAAASIPDARNERCRGDGRDELLSERASLRHDARRAVVKGGDGGIETRLQ